MCENHCFTSSGYEESLTQLAAILAKHFADPRIVGTGNTHTLYINLLLYSLRSHSSLFWGILIDPVANWSQTGPGVKPDWTLISYLFTLLMSHFALLSSVIKTLCTGCWWLLECWKLNRVVSSSQTSKTLWCRPWPATCVTHNPSGQWSASRRSSECWNSFVTLSRSIRSLLAAVDMSQCSKFNRGVSRSY